MNQEPIRFVYFDLDDTLLDHKAAERCGLGEVFEAHAEAFGEVPLADVQATYRTHSIDLWGQYADSAISKDDLQRLRFERTLETLAIGGLESTALNDYYLDCYARHWTLYDDARTAFHAIADRFPVGILTNGFAEVQHAKFERFPELRERSAAVIISEEVGMMKPHPRLFAHAAEVAGVPPATILYVGDSYRSDVRGALDAGWQMAWFTEKEQAEDGVFCFHEWDALMAWLLD